MNPILKERKAFGRRMRAQSKIDQKIYKADKPYFTKVNVYGRNLKDGRRMFINDAIDGLQPAADLVRIMTSCKNNILTRPQKRNINKLTHKIATGNPPHIYQHTVDRMARDIPKWKREFEETNWEDKKGADVWKHLELPTDNDKLGPKWTYIALETGWECIAFGCRCKNICYARRMEYGQGGQGICNRVWRQQKQMRDLPAQSIAEDMVAFIKAGNRGVRFCDTGGIPDQAMLEKVFDSVRIATELLLEDDIKPAGRFYIYATRYDLDWSNRPEHLQINASNETLFNMIPGANFFRKMEDGEEENEERLFCSCNCEACDYCSEGSGETIDQQGH